MVTPLSGRVGIFQGRLVPSATGELQCPPGERWADELASAGALGLSHVELFTEQVLDPTNLVWTPEGRAALRRTASSSGVELVSLCSEEPIAVALDVSASGLADRLVPAAADLRLEIVVLAMDGASNVSPRSALRLAAAVDAVARPLADVGTRVAVELAVPAADGRAFVALVSTPIGVCYDVGNATAAGYAPADEIAALAELVWHVHAKDKDAQGRNVRFGTGEVDFAGAFAALRAVGYDGWITIEATRGDDPVATAAAHRAFLLALDPT